MASRGLLFWVCVMMLSSCVTASSLGVGPSSVRVTGERGAQVNRTITIATDSETAISCTLNSSGDVAGWIKVPSGWINVDPKSQKDVTVTFTIPKDAPSGEYSGGIIVTSKSESSVSGFTGMGVTPSIKVRVTIEVVENASGAFNVTGVRVPDGVNPGEDIPLEISFMSREQFWIKPLISVRVLDSSMQEEYAMVNDNFTLLPGADETVLFTIPSGNLRGTTHFILVNVTWRGVKLWNSMLQLRINSSSEERPVEVVSGDMVSLNAEGDALYKGKPVLIKAMFRNSGNAPVLASLKLNVSRGVSSEYIETQERAVQPGDEADYVAQYVPKSYGFYEAEGFIEYSGLKTDSLRAGFMVHESAEGQLEGTPLWKYLVAAGIIVLIAVVVAFAVWKTFSVRKKKGKKN
ncbi:MAG: hypothetical protein NTU61_01035 [Candidatus Altiarchaeota archaeon]|nr:hypothetical protein [Candidatus Altiarchaeota archaeon]